MGGLPLPTGPVCYHPCLQRRYYQKQFFAACGCQDTVAFFHYAVAFFQYAVAFFQYAVAFSQYVVVAAFFQFVSSHLSCVSWPPYPAKRHLQKVSVCDAFGVPVGAIVRPKQNGLHSPCDPGNDVIQHFGKAHHVQIL